MPKCLKKPANMYTFMPSDAASAFVIRPRGDELFVVHHAELQQLPKLLGCTGQADWHIELSSALGVTEAGKLVPLMYTGAVTYSLKMDAYVINEKRMPPEVKEYQVTFTVS